MARQPTRAELAAALIKIYDELQDIKMVLARYAEPLIEQHNARAFKAMRQKI